MSEEDKTEWPKGAVEMTKQLDMLTDEPLELAVALRQLGEKRAGEEAEGDNEAKIWAKFSQAMSELVRDLEALNQPSRAADAKSE
jgi:hypothetical protein